jgi:hypothetical protein
MELGDWLIIAIIFGAILIGSGYLQAHNPGAYSVVDSTWTKVSTGAYDLFNNFVTQMKKPTAIAGTNITGGG